MLKSMGFGAAVVEPSRALESTPNARSKSGAIALRQSVAYARRMHRAAPLFASSLLVVCAAFACTSGSQTPASTTSQSGDASSGASSSLVMECQSLAQNFEQKCAGDDVRPCLWSAYAKLCATGQTQLLIDSMKCLDSSTCRTFSDPNEGEACLAKLHAMSETAAAKSFLQSGCNECDAGNCGTVRGTDEIFPYLLDSDFTALGSCASQVMCSSAFPVSCESDQNFGYFSCLAGD
jgi:hypothetical protein